MQKDFSKINEASYLSVDNFQRYRAIMHFFYQQHRQMNDLLYRNDILDHMHTNTFEVAYTEKELEQDLGSLVKWGNIIPRQEMSEPKSIEEYKNKHFRYQISEVSIAIEEMLDKIENRSDGRHGSLDKNTFERFLACLLLLQEDLETSELLNAWDDIRTHFTNIKNNTSDYIGYLHSEKAENLMQTEAFLVFKDQFIFYLRDFIVTMQNTAYGIQDVLRHIPSQRLEEVYQLVLTKEKNIPRAEVLTFNEENFRTEFYGGWKSMQAWFLNEPNKTSEYDSLMRQTNYAISKMTRMIQRFSDRKQQYQSRKRDYMQLANWFYQCEDIEEAHQLSSVMFGAAHTKHYYAEPFETSNKYADIWEVPPTIHTTEPRIQEYRMKTKAQSFQRKSKEKQEVIEQVLAERLALERQITNYIIDQKIDLATCGVVSIEVRKVFLRWISLSYQRENSAITTEFGFQITTIIDKNRRITLESEDGTLQMPHVRFVLI